MTTTHRVPTAEERKFYQCPDWCTRWDHHADGISFDSQPAHYGPEFGPVHTQLIGNTFEACVYVGKEAGFVSDPDELRRIAEGALKAADWIEAHR